MKKLLIYLLIFAAGGWWFFGGKLFASMPPITLSGTHVLAGHAPGDHALYALGGPCAIHGASVGYDFNSWTMGFLSKLGARGLISFMNEANYKGIAQSAKLTGTCMASLLNECQRNGDIQHLILIPEDAAALDQMQHASIAPGHGFYLKGRYLAFEEGTIGGKSFNGNMPGTGYFLVEAVGAE